MTPETALAVLQLSAQIGMLRDPLAAKAADGALEAAPLRAAINGLLNGPHMDPTLPHRPGSDEPREDGMRLGHVAGAAAGGVKTLALAEGWDASDESRRDMA